MKLLKLTILFFILTTAAYAEPTPLYKIGIINPSSGAFHSVGNDCKLGFDAAIKELDPTYLKQLSFITEDDQSSPKMALNSLHKLLLNENLIATTAFSSSAALALNPISIKNELPIIALSAHPNFRKQNKYAFSHWPDYEIEIRYYLEHLKKGKYKRVSILTTEHDYTLAIRNLLKTSLKEIDTQVVVDETINEGSDYRAIIPKIINKNSDIVFLSVFNPSFSQIIKLLYEHHYQGDRLSIGANANPSSFKNAGIQAIEGTSFYVQNYNYEFFRKILNGLKIKPDNSSYTFCCYLGMTKLLRAATTLLKSNHLSRENLLKAMNNIDKLNFDDLVISTDNRTLILDSARVVARNGNLIFE